MKISLIINPSKLMGETAENIKCVREWVRDNLGNEVSPEDSDCIITLGGDGTLLYAMGQFGPKHMYFGVNMGHLGFLTSSEHASFQVDMADVFIEGNYRKQVSYGLKWKGNGLLGCAVNDVVVKGADNTRISDFSVHINDSHVCSPKSDGLIVSTPLGSTAYNLSVGGPVMNPTAKGFILNNIATHSLNMRPLILKSGDILKILPKMKTSLIVDGRLQGILKEELMIESDPCPYVILRNKEWDFYNVMKRKLHWGRRGGADD